MEVTFTLTPEDILQFARHYYRTRTLKIRPALLYTFLGIVLLVVSASLLASLDLWRKTGTVPWAMIGGAALFLGGACFYLPPTRGRIVKYTRKQPEIVMPHTISISAEWLSAKTSLSEAKYSWQRVHSVEEDAGNFYVFVSKTHAQIIPRRVFISSPQAQAFMDRARLYWDAAKTGRTVSDAVAAEENGVWPPPPRPVIAEETTG